MDTITNRVAEVLEPKGYVKQKVDTDKDYASLFTGESNAYMVMYNATKKLVALKVCGMDNSAPDNQWKSISTWIFDPDKDTSKEINSISNDMSISVEPSSMPGRTCVCRSIMGESPFGPQKSITMWPDSSSLSSVTCVCITR